jgi:hypothetical protein
VLIGLLASLALADDPASTAPEPAVASTAPAPDEKGIATSFTDNFQIRYWKDSARLPDPSDVPVFNYIEQVNRLNAGFSKGPWAFELQVDEVSLFLDRYYLDDELYVEHELHAPDLYWPLPGDEWYLNPEKIRVKYEKPKAVVVLGDSYAAFGRGIALNLNRNVDIDVDTSLQGVKATFRPGAYDVTVLAGQLNRQQVSQDNPNADPPGIEGDLRHDVAAVEVVRYGVGPANIGAHGAFYKFATETGLANGFEQLTESGPTTAVGGATLEMTGVGGVDWYGEGDVFGFSDDMPQPLPSAVGKNPLGYAAYASASAYPGPFVLLVEGKRYYQANRVNSLLSTEGYEVAIAPTLEYERAITEDSASALGSNDIWGGRTELDWAAIPAKLTPGVSVAVYRDLDLGVPHANTVPETIIHPMATLQYLADEASIIANFGVRTEDRDGDAFGYDQEIHGDSSFQFPLGPLTGVVALSGEKVHLGPSTFADSTDYFQGESAWTISKGSAVALTWFTDYSDFDRIDSVGNLSDKVYGAAELQVKPSTAVTLKAFYGAYKAGIRCSGGQCRQLPGFDGARFTATATF